MRSAFIFAIFMSLLPFLAMGFSPSLVLPRRQRGSMGHIRSKFITESGTSFPPGAVKRRGLHVVSMQQAADIVMPELEVEEEERTTKSTKFSEYVEDASVLKRNVSDLWNGVVPQGLDWRKMGSVRFVYPEGLRVPLSPADKATKPLLLFVPGIDGNGVLGAFKQLEDLSRIYEVRVMQIPAECRLDFEGLVGAISEFLRAWSALSPSKDKPQLFGESAGALSSLAVGIRNPELIHSITLANPATSFDQTAWPFVGNALTQLPKVLLPPSVGQQRISEVLEQLNASQAAEDLSLVTNRSLGDMVYLSSAGPLLAAVALDPHQRNNLLRGVSNDILDIVRAVPRGKATQATRKFLNKTFGLVDVVFDYMAPETIHHRLDKVLAPGASYVNARLKNVSVPVLVLVGKDDNMLPSERDSKRLVKEIPKCTSELVEGGHLILDERYNVTKMMLKSNVAPLSTRKDPVTGFQMPTAAQVENATKSMSTLKLLGSPVFLSTNPNTMEVDVGLENLKQVFKLGRPVLFVGNHQLLALDLGVMIEGVYKETGTLMRGLAHPMLFGEGMSGIPGMQGLVVDGNAFETFGAVPVTPTNAYKLLQQGESVLLFPGGMGEAMHNKDELYKVKWPEKTDFVRLAARFGAMIVPFGGVGASECAQVVANPDEVAEFSQTPLGKLLGQALGGMMTPPGNGRTNFGMQGINAERLTLGSVPPIVAPNAPWGLKRFYFMFGAPISTRGLDLNDAASCARVYQTAQNRVEQCISYLIVNRDNDPYKDLATRVLYEQRYGRQAPTFKPPRLGLSRQQLKAKRSKQESISSTEVQK